MGRQAVALQSVSELHPQWPPPLVAMHTVPRHEVVQFVQSPPVSPQASCAVPAVQTIPLQQPPLHVSPPVQEGEQVLVTGSQASPEGQSIEVLQPHFAGPPGPTMHTWPRKD